MLAGQHERLDSGIAGCQRTLLSLKTRIKEVESILSVRQAKRELVMERIRSFDTVIGLMHQTVRPDAAGSVQAWAGRYGNRGALRQFLLNSVKDAYPRSVTTEAIVSAVIHRFNLGIGSPRELKKLRDGVRKRLSEMQHKEGLLTSHRVGKVARAWSWNSGPTLAELTLLSAEPGKQRDQEEDTAH